jgi:hypothetical protein
VHVLPQKGEGIEVDGHPQVRLAGL